MSERRWMEYTPLGVIVIVAAALVALALFNEHKSTKVYYEAARKEYEAFKQIVPSDVAARRVHTGYKSYRDEWRSEQDLEAQREMAQTSWWQMWATWIGVGLLVLTLIETNRTNFAVAQSLEHARDVSRRELRAYVNLQTGSFTLLNLVEGGKGVRVMVELSNSGQTPAYDFTTWIKPPVVGLPSDTPFGDPPPIEERFGASILGPNASAHIEWTSAISDDDLQQIRGGAKNVFAWGGADYTDAFGTRRYFIFRCRNGPAFGLNNPGDMIAISPHKAGYKAN